MKDFAFWVEGEVEVPFFRVAGDHFNAGDPILNYDRARGELVVTSQDQWDGLWRVGLLDKEDTQQQPVIDFTKEMVVAVFMGRRGGGHHGRVSIKKVTEDSSSVHVYVENLERTSNGSLVTCDICYPFSIIKFKKIDKPVVFEYSTVEED